VLVAGRVDADGDVGGLRVQQNLDVGLLPVEAVLLVADILDRHTGDVGDPIPGDGARPPGLSGDYDLVGGRQRLAGATDVPGIDAGLRTFAKEQIDDLVGDAVTNLVGMSFGYGFAREEIRLTRQGSPLYGPSVESGCIR